MLLASRSPCTQPGVGPRGGRGCMLHRADFPLLSQGLGRSGGHLPTFRAPRRRQRPGVTGGPSAAAAGTPSVRGASGRGGIAQWWEPSTELGQRRCAVPSASPIVTRAGEPAPGSPAPAAVLSPGSPSARCVALCTLQGCAAWALGLAPHHLTASPCYFRDYCKLPP